MTAQTAIFFQPSIDQLMRLEQDLIASFGLGNCNSLNLALNDFCISFRSEIGLSCSAYSSLNVTGLQASVRVASLISLCIHTATRSACVIMQGQKVAYILEML